MYYEDYLGEKPARLPAHVKQNAIESLDTQLNHVIETIFKGVGYFFMMLAVVAGIRAVINAVQNPSAAAIIGGGLFFAASTVMSWYIYRFLVKRIGNHVSGKIKAIQEDTYELVHVGEVIDKRQSVSYRKNGSGRSYYVTVQGHREVKALNEAIYSQMHLGTTAYIIKLDGWEYAVCGKDGQPRGTF